MAFRFTEEDFKRYVKQDEHGGHHIWHELEDELQALYNVPFSTAPLIARGDRLQTLWISPKNTPRPSWANQAQFFLQRSIEEKRISFGLMVECAGASEAADYGVDPDRDGTRLISALATNTEFTYQLDQLCLSSDWQIWLTIWKKET